MLTAIRKIGNSRGIVIPKHFFEELHLDKEVDLVVEHEMLLLKKPKTSVRKDWEKASQRLSLQKDDGLVWPEFSNAADEDLTW